MANGSGTRGAQEAVGRMSGYGARILACSEIQSDANETERNGASIEWQPISAHCSYATFVMAARHPHIHLHYCALSLFLAHIRTRLQEAGTHSKKYILIKFS